MSSAYDTDSDAEYNVNGPGLGVLNPNASGLIC